MNITNIIIIKNFQYFILAAIIVFALLSLIIKGIGKKFVFLFLFILFVQVFDLTLYFGELFFLLFIPMALFMLILFLYSLQSEAYSSEIVNDENIGRDGNTKTGISKRQSLRGEAINVYSRFVMPVLFSAGLIFLFVKFSGDYTAKFNAEKSIMLAGFINIANDIFFNYGILVFIVILLIFILFLWVISILLIRKKQ
ncbi:MAG: hypothetical protein PHR39_00535 [Actinomycetota bacterium]|nr:hypothetical protein [Actinomycetota bacterium]